MCPEKRPTEDAGKRRGRRVPLSGGQYDWHDNRSASAIAVSIFLEYTRELAPQVLVTLGEVPLSAFRAARLGDDLGATVRFEELLAQGYRHTMMWPEPVEAYLVALDAWAMRWNITMPWCLATATSTLATWLGSPESLGREWMHRGRGGSVPHHEGNLTFTFTHTITNPIIAQLDSSEKTLRKQLDIAVRAFFENVRRTAGEGQANPPLNSAPLQKAEMEHFAWLVRYQILGERWSAIAKDIEHEPRTVMAGAGDAARILGLPLRPSARGRTRGVPESTSRRDPTRW